MTNIEKVTGISREELEAIYLSKVIFAISLGFSESEAREMVQESLKHVIFK